MFARARSISKRSQSHCSVPGRVHGRRCSTSATAADSRRLALDFANSRMKRRKQFLFRLNNAVKVLEITEIKTNKDRTRGERGDNATSRFRSTYGSLSSSSSAVAVDAVAAMLLLDVDDVNSSARSSQNNECPCHIVQTAAGTSCFVLCFPGISMERSEWLAGPCISRRFGNRNRKIIANIPTTARDFNARRSK